MTSKRAQAAEGSDLDPARIFKRLAGRRGLVLAVSGGVDSTALMLLAAGWEGRPPVLVATVDHRLRPEAASEAALVAANAARLGLPSRILTVDARHLSGNLQDWARRQRYKLLTALARDAECDTIVTAHQQDDQAETFLLRLARGSGVYGLAGMRAEEDVDGVRLVRPLLGVPRRALARLVAEGGLAAIDDPSNSDLRFDRIRMRRLLPLLVEAGLQPARLAETAERLGRAAEALDHYAMALLKELFEVDETGIVSGPASAFARVPAEVGLRALALVLRAVAGADYTPELASVQLLLETVGSAGPERSTRRTLSGAIVSVAAGTFRAEREPGRDGLPEVPVSANQRILWDGRFRVDVSDLPGALAVRALGGGRKGWRRVASLPGLYQDGTLVAVPRQAIALYGSGSLDNLATECIVGQRLGLE